jgi:hypothetical protein
MKSNVEMPEVENARLVRPKGRKAQAEELAAERAPREEAPDMTVADNDYSDRLKACVSEAKQCLGKEKSHGMHFCFFKDTTSIPGSTHPSPATLRRRGYVPVLVEEKDGETVKQVHKGVGDVVLWMIDERIPQAKKDQNSRRAVEDVNRMRDGKNHPSLTNLRKDED